MVRAEIKLTRNGNTVTACIPRAMRIALGWLAGERMILELLPDNTLRLRRMVPEDVAPPRIPIVVFQDDQAVNR